MPSINSLTGFWDSFHAENLVKKPLHFKKGTFPSLKLSADDAFRLALKSCEFVQANLTSRHETKMPLRFYINGIRIVDPRLFLLRKEDRNFEGWHARLQKEHALQDYSIVFNGLEVSDDLPELHKFFADLYSEIGVPSQKADITLFAGLYKKTPFGVHDDPSELNLYFPLVGPKRMRLWHPDYGQSNPALVRSHSYEDHLKNSVLLEANPEEDFMAWHGRWWHIAEGSEDFSMSISISLQWPSHRQGWDAAIEKVALELYNASAAKLKTTMIRADFTGQAEDRLPEAYEHAAQSIREIDVSRIRDILTEKWLQKLTSLALVEKKGQPQLPALNEKDIIQCKAGRPIRWSFLTNGELCVATDGKTIVLPKSDEFINLIKTLNQFEPFCVRDLVNGGPQKSGENPNGKRLLSFLNILAAYGGISRVNASSANGAHGAI
jgi:hypothetical protein